MLFSTRSIHPRERISYWREVATRGYVDHDFQPACAPTFNGSVQVASLPGLAISKFNADAHRLERPQSRVARDDADDLLVSALLTGEINLVQDGRELNLSGRGLYLVDPTRPFDIALKKFSTHVIVKIPRKVIDARIGNTGDLTGREFDTRTGIGMLAMGLIELLPTQAEQLDGVAGMKVAEHFVDLTTLTFNSGRGKDTSQSVTRRTALLRLKATIERLLVEPGVKPERIAAEAGISVRYANDLLSDENTSLERFVNERRLERCRTALDDPGQSRRSISEIAYMWGFSDLSHFGRRFKSRYGLTPTDYRREAAQREFEQARDLQA